LVGSKISRPIPENFGAVHFSGTRDRSATDGKAAAEAGTIAAVLHVHRAARADGLADSLAALLAVPLADPFASEVVAVPTRGMERWLTQRMSAVLGARDGHADGICAGVLFPSPHRLVTHAVAAAPGTGPEDDPLLPERGAGPPLPGGAE